jgi:hypothetical protein
MVGSWLEERTIVFLSTVMLLAIAAVGTIALAYFGSQPSDEEATL